MRRFAALGVMVAVTGALGVPLVAGPADAIAVHRVVSGSDGLGAAQRSGELVVRRSKKTVAPNTMGEKITAVPGRGSPGKVRFILKGVGLKQARKIEITNGKAVFSVPPLDTGTYKVRVYYRNLRGEVAFSVTG